MLRENSLLSSIYDNISVMCAWHREQLFYILLLVLQEEVCIVPFTTGPVYFACLLQRTILSSSSSFSLFPSMNCKGHCIGEIFHMTVEGTGVITF